MEGESIVRLEQCKTLPVFLQIAQQMCHLEIFHYVWSAFTQWNHVIETQVRRLYALSANTTPHFIALDKSVVIDRFCRCVMLFGAPRMSILHTFPPHMRSMSLICFSTLPTLFIAFMARQLMLCLVFPICIEHPSLAWMSILRKRMLMCLHIDRAFGMAWQQFNQVLNWRTPILLTKKRKFKIRPAIFSFTNIAFYCLWKWPTWSSACVMATKKLLLLGSPDCEIKNSTATTLAFHASKCTS